MLGVRGIVLDRRVEPDPVALLVALVEGRLDRSAAPASTPPSAATAATATRLLAPLRVSLALVGRALFFLRLFIAELFICGLGLIGLGLAQLRFDLCLDLVAQVEIGVRLLTF